VPEYGQNGRNVHRKPGAHTHAASPVSTFFPYTPPGVWPVNQADTNPVPVVPFFTLNPKGR
jgi:hypothetical protein